MKCEWNLGAFESRSERPSRLERRSHRAAFDLNARLLRELSAERPSSAASTPAKVFLRAVSLVLFIATLALLVLGVLMIVRASFVFKVLGVLLVLIAIELRPRLPRLRDTLGATSREESPALHALIDDMTKVVGARRIDLVIIDDSFNAWCGTFGLRRRSALGIGLPLWYALTPQARVALLGHELGHLVNGDPAQGLLTQPALTTFGRLADLFNPRALVHRSAGNMGLIEMLTSAVSFILFTPVHHIAVRLHYRLWTIAATDHQHAELHADALAADLGGSAGAEELMTCLVMSETVETALRRKVRTATSAADLSDEVQRALVDERDRIARREQYSMRIEASIAATHPPTGMRRRLVAAWPSTQPRITVDASTMATIDSELAKDLARVRRALQHS